MVTFEFQGVVYHMPGLRFTPALIPGMSWILSKLPKTRLGPHGSQLVVSGLHCLEATLRQTRQLISSIHHPDNWSLICPTTQPSGLHAAASTARGSHFAPITTKPALTVRVQQT